MKIAPLIAIIFAFFLIAIYPIYSDDGIDENLGNAWNAGNRVNVFALGMDERGGMC